MNQDFKHAAQAVWQETQASLAEGRQRMQDYSERSNSCKEVINLLKGLPDRTSHDIMLPLGKAAFLPARLADAERCHVTLGHGVQMECSRVKAIAILDQQMQGLDVAMHTAEEELEALELRMLIADSTLKTSREEGAGVIDICEEDDLALLSEKPSQSAAYPTPCSSIPPDGRSLMTDESRGEPLALQGSEGSKSGRRRSVTFAEAPLMEGPGQGGLPKSPGLRKGFFGKPKPVLKRASSISNDSSSTVDTALQERRDPPASGGGGQAQSSVDEAFSGVVVERPVCSRAELLQTHSAEDAAASQDQGKSRTDLLPVENENPARKVSRFKQLRQKPV